MTEDKHARTPARIRTGLCACALAGLIVSGCGSGSASPTVASLGARGAGHSVRAALLSQSQSDADMVSFARCMRAHGISMSDPFHRPGHDGLSIDLPTRDTATAAAYGACNHFMAPIIQMKERAGSALVAPELPALTRYAECMRSRQIDMLDPTPQGALSLGIVPGITDSYGRYSPQFRSADAACRHLLPASAHDDGSGP